MSDKHMQHGTKQSGFVAILTVIFFTLLLTVISVGFLRLMIQEQEQARQDDQSKSAYQSAQAGVEDAKRAILHCRSEPNPIIRSNCLTSLYRSTCPGFNKHPNPFESIGIPTAGSTGTGVGSSEASQGYSCVIVTPNTGGLNGKLTVNTSSDATLLELRTVTDYTRIRIKWHQFSSDNTPHIPPAGTFIDTNGPPDTGGNPRLPNWPSSAGLSAPAMLRAKLIALPNSGAFSLNPATNQVRVSDLFLYPSARGIDAANANVYKTTARYETKCIPALTSRPDRTSDYGGYACAMDITFVDALNNPVPQLANRYLLLQAMYQTTHYEVTAFNDNISPINPVLFDGVQPTIDATGYTGDVYRRVQVKVRFGTESLATNAALDTGLGICKDFLVGGSADIFENNCD